MKRIINLNIRRYDPETEEVSTVTYEIEAEQDTTILDILNHLNENQQAAISYRFSCRMSICGSCGAMVNGRPTLMCSTFIRDLPDDITIEPLRNFPVVRDLVVDTDNAMDKMRDALPYTSFATQKSQKPIKQTPEDLEKLKQTSQCIKCMLCYSACPVYGLDNDFIGPAATATAYRYDQDNHDQIKEQRMDSLTSKDGVWKCSFVGECSVVCPKNVDPALAIQKMKIMGVMHSAKKVLGIKKNRSQKATSTHQTKS